MTAQRPAARRGPIVVIAIVLLAVAFGGLWYLFLRPDGPAPVALGDAPTQAPSSAPATSTTEPTDAPSAGASTAPAATTGTTDGIAGSWAVDPSVGSFSDFSGSFVGYRVQETLASVGAKTAVGRTPDVTGSLTIDGTTVTAGEFTADLTTLESDDNRRDGQLGRQGLETDQFPTATFTLTAPVDLGSVPSEGEAFQATATGDLTLHGVTKSVQIPLEGRIQGGVVTIVGSLPILFADYGMSSPESMMVLSVEDNGVLELQLQLTRA